MCLSIQFINVLKSFSQKVYYFDMLDFKAKRIQMQNFLSGKEEFYKFIIKNKNMIKQID